LCVETWVGLCLFIMNKRRKEFEKFLMTVYGEFVFCWRFAIICVELGCTKDESWWEYVWGLVVV